MKTFFARITGKLLGDGSISKSNETYARFQFNHRIEDECWTRYCYEQLKSYIPLTPPVRRFSTNPIEHYYDFVRSRKSDTILQLHNAWYPNDGRKRVPFPLLNDYFTAETLAWWYQDDGHLKIVNGAINRIILATNGFDPSDVQGLQQLLFNRFRLSFKRDGQNRLILYDKYQVLHFLYIVEPWMQPCMARKKNPNVPPKTYAKKPAIRIPTNIQLQRPTKEMNDALVALDYFFDKSHVNMERVAEQFLPRHIQTIDKKHYQVRLTEENRERLYQLIRQTGLSLSELATWCFDTKKETFRKESL